MLSTAVLLGLTLVAAATDVLRQRFTTGTPIAASWRAWPSARRASAWLSADGGAEAGLWCIGSARRRCTIACAVCWRAAD